jgi:hypothetical protein
VIYWGAPFLPEQDQTWESLKAVASELQQLLPILTADGVPADHVVRPSNPAVETAVRRSGGKAHLLLANTASTAEETTLSFHRIPARALTPIGKTTVAAPSASPFRFTLKPFEVALFTIEP